MDENFDSMRRSIVCVLLLIVECFRPGHAYGRDLLAPSCPSNNPPEKAERIANGYDSPLGRYPYMASLKNFQGDHICGGVLIDHDLVLTAAHCVHPSIGGTEQYPRIEIGATRAKNDKDSEFRETCRTIIHQSYNYARITAGYDIALIQLEGNSTKTPVKLFRDSLSPGQDSRAMGFGVTEKGEIPPTLQEIDMKIKANEECEKDLEEDCERANAGEGCNFLSSMICAQVFDGDVCKGDSGGPLIFVDSKVETGCGKDDYLVGLTSFGLGCVGERALRYPGVYTYVPAFADWIITRGGAGPKKVNRIIYENPDADEKKCARFDERSFGNIEVAETPKTPPPEPPKPQPPKKRPCFWRSGNWFPPGCKRRG